MLQEDIKNMNRLCEHTGERETFSGHDKICDVRNMCCALSVSVMQYSSRKAHQ